MKNMKLIFTGCFLFLATIMMAQPKKVVADKIVAVVGDRIILQSEVKNSIADISRQGGQVPENAECLILEQALVSKVLMLQAEKDSLPVSEEEVEAELDQRIRYFITQYGTQDVLEQVAGKTVYQIKDDARASVKERKLAEAMQQKIVSNVRITPSEVKAYFDKIPKDSLPFFETEVEIGQIVLYPKANRDLEKYVVDEMNNYKQQVESKIATFEQLVKKYSEDPGSKDRGGVFQVNRNDKNVDPAFLSAAFRLKEGEISPVVKSKFGYHLIQMVQRNGDDAVVRHILRIPPVTDVEIKEAVDRLDTIRSKLIAGTLQFNAAASAYTEDEQAKFAGPFLTGRDGSTYLTIDQLDKDIVTQLDKMQIGEFSQPLQYVDERSKKAVRILYFKSRSEPHRMNLADDYNKISQMALEEKKVFTLEKWLNTHIPAYYIMLDADHDNCQQLTRWITTAAAAK
jgi:Parvulin-like peptidyl-prolyl isomerase